MLSGTIAPGPGGETLIETSFGTLALDQRLPLPTGTTVGIERLGAADPKLAAEPSQQANVWLALDEILAVLDKSAPALAAQLHAELAPGTASELAGTLLFLAGVLYGGRWPGDAIDRALEGAGADRLKTRLAGDLAELGRLSADRATGDWSVLTFPLLWGADVQSLHLFLRRRFGPEETPESGSRFVVEAELSRLGALQLDGLMRGKRLDLVLRTHAALPAALREEATAIFRRASAASGFYGDIVFATAAQFTVAPMTALRRHVELSI
jgi:hypothetical protein